VVFNNILIEFGVTMNPERLIYRCLKESYRKSGQANIYSEWPEVRFITIMVYNHDVNLLDEK
jgi:hypothetical protein